MTNDEARSEARGMIKDAFSDIYRAVDNGRYPGEPYLDALFPDDSERIKKHLLAYARKLRLGNLED